MEKKRQVIRGMRSLIIRTKCLSEIAYHHIDLIKQFAYAKRGPCNKKCDYNFDCRMNGNAKHSLHESIYWWIENEGKRKYKNAESRVVTPPEVDQARY